MSEPEETDWPKSILKRLAKVSAEMERLRTDDEANTGKYDYRFLSLPALLAALKNPLTENGLAVLQPVTTTSDGLTKVDTLLVDLESGESLTFPGMGWPTKGEPQSAGSALTYYRRYNLTALFALEVIDDDGAQAQRAAVDPHRRTPAEIEIRSLIGKVDRQTRNAFASDFKFQFGVALMDLPESHHGDALTWTKEWFVHQANPEQPPLPEESL